MNNCNDSASILTQALEELKMEQGENFSLDKINLSELERRTGIPRGKLRGLQKNGFKEKPHGLLGRKSSTTVLTGYTGILDNLLRKGVYNSSVALDKLKEFGYVGGQTQIKVYLKEHKDLLPPKRQAVSPQGNRGRRYSSEPGEAYQMDWGFVNVECVDGTVFQFACFAMICHHCGQRYIEFFPNARQESLFIGMIHAFQYMGIPERVLTDNMKSIVLHRDSEGRPVWHPDYEAFMKAVGFETRLCKPRHPFTKGAVERLVRFVKENFISGRTFYNLTDLNESALDWCNKQNNTYHRAVACVPAEEHYVACAKAAREIDKKKEIAMYLCPLRSISFDGFVCYEGRRFGIPYWYTEHRCRVKREGTALYIYNLDLSKLLVKHPITWSKHDSFCKDQYCEHQPVEVPSVPVKVALQQSEPKKYISGFSKFHFDVEESDENA